MTYQQATERAQAKARQGYGSAHVIRDGGQYLVVRSDQIDPGGKLLGLREAGELRLFVGATL